MSKFTQEELEAAYEQMRAERARDIEHAVEAANKLSGLTGDPFRAQTAGYYGNCNCGCPTPHAVNYRLVLQLCQYDVWDTHINKLKSAGVEMGEWDRNYSHPPKGTFDLTADESYKGRQKVFTVTFAYYDSHYGGY